MQQAIEASNEAIQRVNELQDGLTEGETAYFEMEIARAKADQAIAYAIVHLGEMIQDFGIRLQTKQT